MASRQRTHHGFLPRAPWASKSYRMKEPRTEDAWEGNGVNHTPKTLKNFKDFGGSMHRGNHWFEDVRSHFRRLREFDRAFNTSNSSCNWVSRRKLECIIFVRESANWAPEWTQRRFTPSPISSLMALACNIVRSTESTWFLWANHGLSWPHEECDCLQSNQKLWPWK